MICETCVRSIKFEILHWPMYSAFEAMYSYFRSSKLK